MASKVCVPALNPEGHCTMLAVDVIHRCCSLRTVSDFPPLEVFMVHSRTMKVIVLRDRTFRPVPAQGSLDSVSEVHGLSSNRD